MLGWSLVALLGVGAGAVMMVATLPLDFAARMAGAEVPADVRLAGTVWQGSASQHGVRAQWHSRVWDSVNRLAWVADVQVTGPQTDLQGQWAAGPQGVVLAPLHGRLGWALIDAFAPGLEITCATTAVVNLESLRIGVADRAAQGQIALAAGSCSRVDGTVTNVPLPALQARVGTMAEGIEMALAGAAAPDTPLGNLLLTPDDRLRITLHAAGAAMVPGLPGNGDSRIELPLALFAQ